MLKTGYIAHERIKHIITVQRKSKKKKKNQQKQTNKNQKKPTDLHGIAKDGKLFFPQWGRKSVETLLEKTHLLVTYNLQSSVKQ